MTTSSPAAPEWVNAAAAADRLGVTPDALAAYAHRGLLVLREDDGAVAAAGLGRLLRSRLPAQRPARTATPPAEAAPFVIETALVDDAAAGLRLRGRPIVTLAEQAGLEDAARLLWCAKGDPFAGLSARPTAMLGADARSRSLSFLAARAAVDPPMAGRTDCAVVREAGALLTDLTDTLCGGSRGGLLHERLAKTWRLDGARIDVVRQALVLCADAAPDAATLAVRATAASGASLASALLCGVAAVSGPAEAGELMQAGLFILDARRSGDACAAVRQRLEQGLPLPGFCADAVAKPDARALAKAVPWGEDVQDLVLAAEAIAGRTYTFDFALAATARALNLPGDGALALRMLGRCTGWIGHALEQRRAGSPLPVRGRYTPEAPAAEVADAA